MVLDCVLDDLVDSRKTKKVVVEGEEVFLPVGKYGVAAAGANGISEVGQAEAVHAGKVPSRCRSCTKVYVTIDELTDHGLYGAKCMAIRYARCKVFTTL